MQNTRANERRELWVFKGMPEEAPLRCGPASRKIASIIGLDVKCVILHLVMNMHHHI